MSVLNPIFPSATMEQEPLFHCHDCHNRKSRDQFLSCKGLINMVQRVSQPQDAPPAQKRSNIDVRTRNENGVRTVLTCLGTQESPNTPSLSSNSQHNSMKNPLWVQSPIL